MKYEPRFLIDIFLNSLYDRWCCWRASILVTSERPHLYLYTPQHS